MDGTRMEFTAVFVVFCAHYCLVQFRVTGNLECCESQNGKEWTLIRAKYGIASGNFGPVLPTSARSNRQERTHRISSLDRTARGICQKEFSP